jgi:aromatic ring hydroxylase
MLRCRTREELARRMRALKAGADFTYGLIGRSPEQVAGLITGLAMNPSVLESLHAGFGENLMRYYERARRDDLYLCFAVVPPTGLRSRELFPGQERDDPSLQVVAENDSGVMVSGMKMLATGAVFADEVWIGNLTPLDEKFRKGKHHSGAAFEQAWRIALVPQAMRPASRRKPTIRCPIASTKPTASGLRARPYPVGARVSA